MGVHDDSEEGVEEDEDEEGVEDEDDNDEFAEESDGDEGNSCKQTAGLSSSMAPND